MLRLLQRCIAVFLACALAAAAPGASAWAAAARVVPVKVNAPVTRAHGAARHDYRLATPGLPFNSGFKLNPTVSDSLIPTLTVEGRTDVLGTNADAALPVGVLPAAEASVLPGLGKAATAEVSRLPGLDAPTTDGAGAGSPVRSIVTEGAYWQPSERVASGLNRIKAYFAGAENNVDLFGGSTFSGKRSANKSGLSKAQPQAGSDDDAAPPAPPSNDGGDNGGGGKSWFGLGKTAVMFIAALLVAQVGVEALGVAMPTLMQKTFGDFTAVAQLAIFSSIASIIGRQLGAVVVEKLGLRKTYLGSTFIRLLSMTALVTLLATGHMTLPLMIGFYSINGLLGGVAITAEASIPPALVGKDQAKIERFWTIEQTALEVLGFLGPIAFGSIVGGFGFMPALIAFPVTFAAALAMMFFSLRIPQKVEMARLADLKQKKEAGQATGVGSVFKQFFRRVGHGAKLVWRNPVLRTAFLAYTAIMILNPFLYSMIGPGYGLLVAGSGEGAAELATSIGGWLTGLYSLGGLFGGLLMMREQAKLKKLPEAEQNEELRKSMLKWIKWTTFSLAALITLTIPLPLLGALIPGLPAWAGTLSLPALALIPYGIAQVISMVKLKSFFQSQVPDAEKDMPSAMGFFGSASLAVSTVGLLGLKYLFKGFDGFTPFIVIAALMAPLAAYYWYANRQLDKATKKSDSGQ